MTNTIAPIGWFEIAGSDIAKSETFYSGLFNWSFTNDDAVPGYRIANAGDGPAGGVTTAQAGMPSTYAIFSVMVPDVGATCEQVVKLGGAVNVGPEALDNGLTFANVADPDGNHFGVFSPPAG